MGKTAAVEVVVAKVETSKYTFQGVGTDRESAMAAVIRAMRKHQRANGGDLQWMLQCAEEAHVVTLRPGAMMRDWEEMGA